MYLRTTIMLIVKNQVSYHCINSIFSLKLSNQIKLNLSLCSLCYAETCDELSGPISASLRPGNTVHFEQMSPRWQAVSNPIVRFDRPEIWTSDQRWNRSGFSRPNPTGKFQNHCRLTGSLQKVFVHCSMYHIKNFQKFQIYIRTERLI